MTVALVTGVGKRTGLGFEVCRQLAGDGATVWLTARRGAAAEELAGEIDGDVRPLALDVTDPGQIATAAAAVGATGLDVLICNAAGTAPWGETTDGADLDIARAVLEATLFGNWALAQAFLPLLRQSGAGRLVMVSSGAGSHGDRAFGLHTPNAMGPSYSVAKAALNALTVKLAQQEPAPSVRINAVCPGFTATFEGGAGMGARPVPDGAASILWAAQIGNDGPTGGFFRDGAPLAW